MTSPGTCRYPRKRSTQYFADKDEIVDYGSGLTTMEKDKTIFEDIKSKAKNAVDELVKVAECIKK